MNRNEDSNTTQQREAGVQHAMNFAEIFLHGTARVMDIQLDAVRTFLQYQTRGAAVFGVPDCSKIFDRSENGLSRLVEASADKTLAYMRQANEAFSEMQSSLGHVIEQQIQEVSEQLQTGLEEGRRIADKGLQEGKRMIKETADEAAQRSAAPARKR
ncbi:MAG: phasin family protein [Gammaproteobacteria bacterium]